MWSRFSISRVAPSAIGSITVGTYRGSMTQNSVAGLTRQHQPLMRPNFTLSTRGWTELFVRPKSSYKFATGDVTAKIGMALEEKYRI